MSGPAVAAKLRVLPYCLALGLLSLGAWCIWAGESRAKPTESASTAAPAPGELGLWKGKPVPVDDRTVAILETDQVSLMEYHLGEEPPLWFAQVSGFGNRAAFHPPELCYVGNHFQVMERGPIEVMVNGIPRRLMRLVIAQDGQQFEAWYWFTAGGRITPNYYQQQAWLLLDALQRKPMEGTLVRISTQIEDAAQAHRRLLAFVKSWDTQMTMERSHGA